MEFVGDDHQSDFSDSSFGSEDGEDVEHPPLYVAIAKNDVKQLTELLSLDYTNFDSLDESKKGEYRTALHVAAIYNVGSSHFEVAEALLNNGADPNATDGLITNCGLTPLWYLVKNCDLKILNQFLKFKANCNWLNVEKSSLLFPATKNCRNLDVLKFLVQDVGLDVNHQDDSGNSALHYAALFNEIDSHYEVLEYLIKKRADVNARNSDGETPLFNLVGKSNWRVIDLILNHEANVNSVTSSGENILFAFNDKNSDTEVLQKLIKYHGLNVNHTDILKQTPLHYIIDPMKNKKMKVKVIKCFLKNGADVNAPDEDGVTPLIKISLFICEIFEDQSFCVDLDCFNFIIDLTDFNVVHKSVHIFNNYEPEFLSKCILKHLAKLKFLSIPIHSTVLEYISNRTEYNDYFAKCTRELETISNTKPKNSWITYFNLLVDTRRKLKNYAGNQDLIQDFDSNDWLNKFPIYGSSIKKNVEKGLERRKLFDKSAVLLNDCLPIFDSTHLIINDILDCVLSKKDLSQFCKCRFLPE